MSPLLWLARFFFIGIVLLEASVAFPLTPEEVLKLKAAGVSEETIQMMLQKEREDKIPAKMREQGYATEHMGTWKLQDGRTITSTGKRRQPLPSASDYPPSSFYTPDVYPSLSFPSPEGQPSSSRPTPPHLPHHPYLPSSR